jgi:aryl-alcohol dehydrogenase-like predicted oxidoreductase
VPISGTRKHERVEENLGVADVALTAEDLDEIEATASRITMQDAQLPEAILQLSYQ